MSRFKYGIIKVKSHSPLRELIDVPNENGVLTLGYPAFGPNYFSRNVEAMQLSYSHPESQESISFREPTTCESIYAAAYRFAELARPMIFNPGWLQLGEIIKTSEGVYANAPRQVFDGLEVDETKLKQLLDGARWFTVNGHDVGIVPDKRDLRGFGFAEYETFSLGQQDCDTFVKSGLARILEHSDAEKVKKLRAIANSKNYPNGVNVSGFDRVNAPITQVASLDSDYFGHGKLGVGCYGWRNDNLGYAFGVLDSRKNSRRAS